MKKVKNKLLLPLLLLLTVGTRANDPTDSSVYYEKIVEKFKDSVNNALKYSTGVIKTASGQVKLDVPTGFKFLDKDQSKYVLTKLWGNPESAAEEVIGMIFPEGSDPFADSNYAFVVTYSEIGYVKDEDADKINYDEMLKNLQNEEKEENDKRSKAGYPSVHVVGWAEKPYYDKQRKILHWAKEIAFGGEDGPHTLNYEIRILGRKGMVSLNAVGKMYDLPLVDRDISKVLGVASFTDGNSYFDFDPKVDKVAAWTIGALVAGKILAKVGFFAVILKFLAPLWKFILLAFAGVGAWFRKRLGRKKEGTDYRTEEAQPDGITGEQPEGTEAGHDGIEVVKPEGTEAGHDGIEAVKPEGTEAGHNGVEGTHAEVKPEGGEG
ncbi:DUF2167 domain-containing protein [Puia sp. P3]|uniref:DUF2167 domain-containing protein n=1 Tax=Puia sp. P3 TaxID=3423952 RepID=UPI003D66AA95